MEDDEELRVPMVSHTSSQTSTAPPQRQLHGRNPLVSQYSLPAITGCSVQVTIDHPAMSATGRHMSSPSGRGSPLFVDPMIDHRSNQREPTPTSASKMPECSPVLAIRAMDGILLMTVIVIQGTIINYFIISYNAGYMVMYFFFFADLVITLVVGWAMTASYRHARSKLKHSCSPKPAGIFGYHPMVFISWLVYAGILVVKILVIYCTGIPFKLHHHVGFFGANTLSLAIASASIVLILLVNSQHYIISKSALNYFVASLCTSSALEVFDTVDFFYILLDFDLFQELSTVMLLVILGLTCVNLMLPTVSLWQLSLCDFGEMEAPRLIVVLYYTFKLLSVDVSYLILRVYFDWNFEAFHLSIFAVKNVMRIFLDVRYMVPDYIYVYKNGLRVDQGSHSFTPAGVRSSSHSYVEPGSGGSVYGQGSIKEVLSRRGMSESNVNGRSHVRTVR